MFQELIQVPARAVLALTPAGRAPHRQRPQTYDGNMPRPRPRLNTQLPAGVYVAVGGAVGATLRGALDALAPMQLGALAASTIIVNLLGAFLMGMLTTTWMLRRGQSDAWDRLKLLLGTGGLGAFTTYSTFALALTRDLSWVAIGEGVAVVGAGIVTVVGGVVAARRLAGGRAAGAGAGRNTGAAPRTRPAKGEHA